MADQVKLIIPTAINILTAANAEFLRRNTTGETLEVHLPSLRRRALLVVSEAGTLPIQSVVEDDDSFTR